MSELKVMMHIVSDGELNIIEYPIVDAILDKKEEEYFSSGSSGVRD